jgi:uncharacterized protein (TIGR02444 family)
MIDQGDDFWCFSRTVYDDAQACCLDLQDRFGFDVNMLLFCCWSAARGQVLSDAKTEEILVITRPWRRNVIEPLRSARRWLKGRADPGLKGPADPTGSEDLRRRILELELEGEKVEQALIIGAHSAARGSIDGAATDASLSARQRASRNLTTYARVIGAGQTMEMTRQLEALVTSTFAREADGAIVTEVGRFGVRR